MAHVCFTCFVWTKMCHQSWLVPAYDFMFVSVQPVMCDLQKVIMAEHESMCSLGAMAHGAKNTAHANLSQLQQQRLCTRTCLCTRMQITIAHMPSGIQASVVNGSI